MPENIRLIEVMFEIRWDFDRKEATEKFYSLVDAMYHDLPNKYGIIYKISPGILSLHCKGSDYNWKTFKNETEKIVDLFTERYGFDPERRIRTELKYLDFFKTGSGGINMLPYLEEKFHIKIDLSSIQTEADTLGFSVTFKEKKGVFKLSFNSGDLLEKGVSIPGIVLENKMTNTGPFGEWKNSLKKDHTYLSDFFKKLTEGNSINFPDSSPIEEKKKVKAKPKKEYRLDDEELAGVLSERKGLSVKEEDIPFFSRENYDSYISEYSGRMTIDLEKWF